LAGADRGRRLEARVAGLEPAEDPARRSGVYEKEGKAGGKMVFVVSENTFSNQRGEDVLLARTILVQTEKAAS
jgi:hypothetical protein